jgi:hypothetical protein
MCEALGSIPALKLKKDKKKKKPKNPQTKNQAGCWWLTLVILAT